MGFVYLMISYLPLAAASQAESPGGEEAQVSTHLHNRQVKDLPGFSHLGVVPILRNDVRGQGIVGDFLGFPSFKELNNLRKQTTAQLITTMFTQVIIKYNGNI